MNNLIKVGYTCPPSGKACIYMDDKTAEEFGSNLKRLTPTGNRQHSSLEVHNNPQLEFAYDPNSRTITVFLPKYNSGEATTALTINRSSMWPWRTQLPIDKKAPLSGLIVLNATLDNEELILRIPPDNELPPATIRVAGRKRGKKGEGVITELRTALDRLKLALRMAPQAKLYGDVKEDANIRPYLNVPLVPENLRITMIKKIVVEREEEIDV